MSAETLRKAAALMRERAEAVSEPEDEWWNVDSFAEVTNYEDAEHFVAFGRPAVALAMADWLDFAAETAEGWTRIGNARPDQWPEPTRMAHGIALTYLGGDSA